MTRCACPGWKITAVPAYNLDKPYHPREAGGVGYLVTIDGFTYYHAGDTDHIPEMHRLSADVALLPVSGTYVMTAEEAVAAALVIKPAIAIPMHYGTLAGTPDDALKIRKSAAGKDSSGRLPQRIARGMPGNQQTSI